MNEEEHKDNYLIEELTLSPAEILAMLAEDEREFVISALQKRFAQDKKRIGDKAAIKFLIAHPGALCNALAHPNDSNEKMEKRLNKFNHALINWEDFVAAKAKRSNQSVIVQELSKHARVLGKIFDKSR